MIGPIRPIREFAMPTILSHPAVPIALAAVAGRKHVSPALLAAGIVASMLPDIDVVGHGYHHSHGFHNALLGHRGLTHSLFMAAVVALVAAGCFRKRSRLTAFIFIFLSTASHGLLDAATNGGSGIAFFSPLFDGRFRLPWRPIEVSSLGFHGMNERLIRVLVSEFRWIWLPALALGAIASALRFARRALGPPRPQ